MTATPLSAETRARILDTAFERVRRHGSAAVSVRAIAAAAGVSRQLVYFHFESRAGLLLAMAEHHDRASGFVDRVAAARSRPPVEAFEALLHAWCDYLPDMLPVARALEAALITGDEGGEAWRRRMDDLREACRRALARIDADGRLAPGWSVGTAADWTWSRIQPSTYEHLVHHRGWSARRYRERTIGGVLADVVR